MINMNKIYGGRLNAQHNCSGKPIIHNGEKFETTTQEGEEIMENEIVEGIEVEAVEVEAAQAEGVEAEAVEVDENDLANEIEDVEDAKDVEINVDDLQNEIQTTQENIIDPTVQVGNYLIYSVDEKDNILEKYLFNRCKIKIYDANKVQFSVKL